MNISTNTTISMNNMKSVDMSEYCCNLRNILQALQERLIALDTQTRLLFPENFFQFILKLIFEVINTGRLNKAHVFFCKTMGNLGQIFVQIEQ